MAELLQIFPKLHAQETDAVAQPTFGTINISGGGTQNASVLLKSDKTSVAVGERFKVRVEIKTNTITVNEFRIVVDFDPTKLQVVDQDTNTVGTQVKNLDTIFLVSDQSQDNTVSSVGRVRFVGKTASGNAFSVNRDVIEIEFQAQATGSSPIRIVTGSTGTQLVRQSGIGVSYTSNEVTLQVTTSSQTGTGGNGGNTGGNTGTGNTGGTGGTGDIGTLPDTAIPAGMGESILLVLSMVLIIAGLKLSLEGRKAKKKID